MQAEERIKELIIAKYGNVRAFATESGISYTTVRSILERGIMNAKAENVFKICHLLGISPDTVADWGISNEQQPTNSHDIDSIIDNAMMFDGKPLTDDDKRAIRAIIAGYMSSKGE
jgi:transcriptional regulator with XRE-family HTH domain